MPKCPGPSPPSSSPPHPVPWGDHLAFKAHLNPDDSQCVIFQLQPFPPEVRPTDPTADLKSPLGCPKNSSNSSQPKLTSSSSSSKCYHHPSLSSGQIPGSHLCFSFSHTSHPSKSHGIYFQSVSQIGHFSSASRPAPWPEPPSPLTWIIAVASYLALLLPPSPTTNIPNTAAKGTTLNVI